MATDITDKIKRMSKDDVFFYGADESLTSEELLTLVSELERKTRALQHYANPKHWRAALISNKVFDWYDPDPNDVTTNGYDIARAALEGKE